MLYTLLKALHWISAKPPLGSYCNGHFYFTDEETEANKDKVKVTQLDRSCMEIYLQVIWPQSPCFELLYRCLLPNSFVQVTPAPCAHICAWAQWSWWSLPVKLWWVTRAGVPEIFQTWTITVKCQISLLLSWISQSHVLHYKLSEIQGRHEFFSGSSAPLGICLSANYCCYVSKVGIPVIQG